MFRVSRRKLICLSAAASLLWRFPVIAAGELAGGKTAFFPETIKILQQAYKTEMVAHNHYLGYALRAVQEGFPNIAYLFKAFAVSEKIHAENYATILSTLKAATSIIPAGIEVKDTRSNLKKASQKELEKIETTYPVFLQSLESEACDGAIVNCMYSWKSHRQHEQKVREILRYSGMFFGSVASKIEKMHLDFHVCSVCGSTIDEPPATPCEICNMSKSHYSQVARPAALG